MLRRTIVSLVLVAGCALFSSLLWLSSNQVKALAPDAVTAAPKPKAVAKTAAIERIRANLAKSITLENGIDPNTPLNEALEFIGKQSGLTFLIDREAFKQDVQMPEPESQPVNLPKIVALRTDTVLRLLLSQVHAGFLIRNDHLEITTMKHLLKSQRCETPSRILVPVNFAFEEQPLDEVLRELTHLTGISIVLDTRRVGASGKSIVTATFNNAPLDTAVKVLANQAELKSVRLDNILFVTTEENATKLQEEYLKSLETDGQGDPAYYMLMLDAAGA